MERSYIAFISYRHLPLEMATAKKLHKRIERFVIPRELRRDGEKKLGLVFRDQDELPISSNLGENITQALDNSQFLIVICTPETAKSPWVMREITYFLEHHDRDHVLAVLADGTPETAFPAPLTELRSADGDLLERIEPLAANIVADSAAKRARLFKTENLRILASLIGCPYDALFRRELRYRRRRAAAAFATFALFAAAFIGMLLNRNAQIREQLQQTLVNESKTLAALSEKAYGEGDYNGALRYALEALPGEERERPYVAEAEYALSRELDLYRQGVMRYVRSLDQESAISTMALSSDGSLLAAADEYGVLRCWDLGSAALRWEQAGKRVLNLCFLENDAALLVLDGDGVSLLNAADGECRWTRDDIFALDLIALSPDASVGLVNSFFRGDGSKERFELLDIASGRTLDAVLETGGAARFCGGAAVSEDRRYAAMLLQQAGGDRASLCLWEIRSGELSLIDEQLFYSAGATACRLMFDGNGDLLLACDDHEGQSFLRLYERASGWTQRFDTPLETEKVVLQTGSAASLFAGIDLLDCAGDLAAVGSEHDLYMIDLTSGEILWHKTLSAFLLAGRMYENACLGLVLSDGTVGFCTNDGYWSDDEGVYNFRSGYDLALAAIAGESYPVSSVVLVPEEYPQRAALVRFVDNALMYPVGAASPETGRVTLISSPSGEMVLALGLDPTGQAIDAFLLNGREGSSGEHFPLPDGGGWDDPGKLALTEDGKLISPCGVLDLSSQVYTKALPDSSLVSARDNARQRVFSACLTGAGEQRLRLYTDGEETAAWPCPEGQWRIEAVGGCGYTLLRGESGALALCSETGERRALEDLDGSVWALGGDRPLLAAWDGERLVIRDLEKGSDVESRELPAATVTLLFTEEGRELLAFSGTGELCVIRCSDGVLLHCSRHGELGLRFRSENASYALAEAKNEDRLLVFYDDLERSEALCLAYDRESQDCAGAYEAVAAYLPGRDSVLVCPQMDGVYLSPFRSRAEIIASAESRLAAETLP